MTESNQAEEIPELEPRVSELEKMMKDLIYAQRQTEMSLTQFIDEMKEFKDEMKEFKDEMKESKQVMNKKWGDLANKMGTIIEDIIAPNIPTMAKQYFGCTEIDELLVRTYKRNKDRTKGREFDIILVFDKTVILNETKTSPSIEAIDQFSKFLDSDIFFDFYPHLSGKKLVPVFSSLHIREDLINYLTKKNIYAMQMKGDIIELVNFKSIKGSKSI